MGNYMLYPWILKLTRETKELWIIQDYDSNMLVLCLASVKKIGKINLV